MSADQITESSGWGALAKRYAVLFFGKTFYAQNEAEDFLVRLFTRCAQEAADTQSARIAELEEALKPFAVCASKILDHADDAAIYLATRDIDYANALKFGDLRCARDILNKGRPAAVTPPPPVTDPA